ncbi:MAG: aminotransferase class I/II-fold pyridoxal phosphate-dependent enzyme, partial [Candidatus Limnocylindrales bacterium]
IQVGTLSKAVGALGGYVAGSVALREMLTQRARPFLFSTSHPPAVVAACREAIRVMDDEPELQERLWANTRRFKAELTRLGFDTGRSETPITPVMMGDPDIAGRFSDRLLEEGVFAQPVVFPTVAIDKSRLRTIVTAAHTGEQLDTALAAFDRVGRDLGLIAG